MRLDFTSTLYFYLSLFTSPMASSRQYSHPMRRITKTTAPPGDTNDVAGTLAPSKVVADSAMNAAVAALIPAAIPLYVNSFPQIYSVSLIKRSPCMVELARVQIRSALGTAKYWHDCRSTSKPGTRTIAH